MQQGTITVVATALGISGTLSGIVVGHVLSRSWQQKQWLQDRRNEEFREVLTSIWRATSKITNVRDFLKPITEEWIMSSSEASVEVFTTLNDRIFIAKDIDRLDLKERRGEAVTSFRKDRNTEAFGSACRQISNDVVKAATARL